MSLIILTRAALLSADGIIYELPHCMHKIEVVGCFAACLARSLCES